jgi:hypothetical protein
MLAPACPMFMAAFRAPTPHARPAPPDRIWGLLTPSLLQTRIATYATPDLLLWHLDETLATYVRNRLINTYNIRLKHLQYTRKTLGSQCKHMQYPDKTLAIYA